VIQVVLHPCFACGAFVAARRLRLQTGSQATLPVVFCPACGTMRVDVAPWQEAADDGLTQGAGVSLAAALPASPTPPHSIPPHLSGLP
jgi:hypothetical protein